MTIIITTTVLLWLLVGMVCCVIITPLMMRMAPADSELMRNLHRLAESLKIKPEALLWWLSTGVLLVGWPMMALWMVLRKHPND